MAELIEPGNVWLVGAGAGLLDLIPVRICLDITAASAAAASA